MNSTPRFTLVSAVHLFLLREDQILLSRRFQTGYQDGNYSLPAGHVDADESCLQALIRETREEIGLQLSAENLHFAHVIHRYEDRESLDFFFTCDNWSGETQNMEPHKCDQLLWTPIQQLPENVVPYVKHAITQYLQGQKYSELGFKK